MVLVPLLGRSEQAAQRSRPGRLQAKKPARNGNPSKLAKRATSERFQIESKSPKALKNNNWRARREGVPNTGDRSTTSEKENTRRVDKASCGNRNKEDSEGNNLVSSISHQVEEPTLVSEKDVIQIVKKLDLLRLSGQHSRMCLFEAVPSRNTPSLNSEQFKSSGNFADIAQIQQVPRKQYSWKLEDSVRGSLHLPADSSQVPTKETQGGTEDEMTEINSHETIQPTLRVVNDTHGAIETDHNQVINWIDDKRGLNMSVSNAEQQRHYAALKNRDVAFKKIIERLNSRNLQDPAKKRDGYEHKWQHRDELGTNGEIMFRKPITGNGRRNATNTDFRIDYWGRETSSYDLTDTNDSDTGTEVKHNNLNPRAREFLSLGYGHNIPALQQRAEAIPSKALESKNNYAAVTPTKRSKPYKTFPARGHVACVANGFPQHFGPSYSSTLNNQISLMQQSAPNFALQSAMQAASLGMPMLPSQPAFNPGAIGATIPPSATVSANYLPGIPGGAFAIPVLQQPAMGPLQRPAVQKPRVPNAGGQQAYEEWIEWRKANEPGYAIECKVRQQRRSQRSKVAKPRHNVEGNKPIVPAAAAA